MNYFMNIFRNRNIIIKMGLNDFKNKFSATSLGIFWGFIQPIVLMFMYFLVFQFLLPSKSPGTIPFSAWFLPGIAMWMFLSDSTLNISFSIRNYSYLVKKIVFPIDMIPFISLTSNIIVGTILFALVTIIAIIVGVVPNLLVYIYAIFCAICFIVALTRFTSTITTLVPDFGKFLETLMQILFWLTPVIWPIDTLNIPHFFEIIVKLNPFTYPVMVFRDAFETTYFIYQNYYLYTIAFWGITLLLYFYGGYVFNKNKKEFADVL